MVDKDLFDNYIEIFIRENSKVNLISKNDEKFLWEKHIFDSLALGKVFEKYSCPKTLLDIGTGGGFPSVPVAMAYPQIKVTALDSIAKKIRAVETFKQELSLDNLLAVCSRVENIKDIFDMTTSRAVASLDKICAYALPKTKKNGYFAAFKSKKAEQEIKDAMPVMKKLGGKIVDVIEYNLPLEEQIERNIIVIQRV